MSSANPLLDAWRDCYGPGADYRWLTRPITDRGEHRKRREAIARWAFAVPDDEALDLIASYGPVVEIGAGTGYWARMLGERGCDVAAYDLMGEDWERWFPAGQYGDVKHGGTEMVEKHGDRTLLLVWPYMDTMAEDALRRYEAVGGQRVVYVGEGEGGCTASAEFFTMLVKLGMDEDEHGENCQHDKAAWREVESLALPQWDGVNDWLWVYERTP